MALFWILIPYHNRVSFRVSGSRLPCWLMCNFQFHDKRLNMIQKEWLTSWHVRKNGTFHLILPRDPLLWPSQCLSLLCVIPNQKKRHRKILFWWRYGCSSWQTVSTPISFVAWLVHTICILTCQIPSYMPNGDIPKKRHRNNQYWWRYCHLLLLTVVNSEQDMLHSDRNHSHFLHSNIVDRCIYI